MKKKQRTQETSRRSAVQSNADAQPGETTTTDDLKIIKPSQQIPFTAFWNYVDSFYRNFTDDDLKLLQDANVSAL